MLKARLPQILIPQISALIWGAFLSLVLFSYTESAFFRPTDEIKEIIFYGGLFLFGVVCVVRFFREKASSVELSVMDGLAAVWLIYILLNIIITKAPPSEGLADLGKMALFLMAIRFYSAYSQEEILRHIKGFLIIFAFAVLLSHQKDSLIIYPFGHMSYYADALLLLIPWAFFFFFLHDDERKISRLFWLGILILLFGAMVQTATRSPMVGFLGMVPFLGWASFKKFRKAGMPIFSWKEIGIISILLLVFGGAFFLFQDQTIGSLRSENVFERFHRLFFFELIPERIETYERYKLYQVTLQGVMERPLTGWGYGNYKFIYPMISGLGADLFLRQPTWMTHPHNIFLHELFEGGVIGLVLLVALMAFVSIALVRWAPQSDVTGNSVSWTVMGVLTGLIIVSQFDTALHDSVFVRFLAIPPLALAYGASKRMFNPMKFHFSRYAFLFSLPILAVLTFLVLRVNASNYFLVQTMKDLDPLRKEKFLSHAQNLNPSSYEILYISSSFCRASGRNGLALRPLKKAHDLFPYVPQIIIDYGWTLADDGRPGEALKVFKRGAVLYPEASAFKTAIRNMEMGLKNN